ncbi:S-layer homology domain-containing protein [Oscillospiraceae bacterium DSM 107454]|uniref:S-layer homology domain-containing protein n=1 Tax=Ructibacterium gallinarum TaxID=2779355 RepID=A0A9D5R916_9FIRM|nr:S-layer homology domain-containing protein [Ructibacterium gallinarum]
MQNRKRMFYLFIFALIVSGKVAAASLTYGQPLEQTTPFSDETNSIAGSWTWAEPEICPKAGTDAYLAVFTPEDTANYEPVTMRVHVTTHPAVPQISEVSARVKSGARLSSAYNFVYTAQGVANEKISGTFVPAEPDRIITHSGVFAFTFYPDDSNYTSIETPVSLAVSSVSNVTGGSGGRPAGTTYTVVYDPGTKGSLLSGKRTETVKTGEMPQAVPLVKPNVDAMFLGWSLDGETLVRPETIAIYEDTVFTAVYQSDAESRQHIAYIQGDEDGCFRPDSSISRAETAAIFSRILEDTREHRTTLPKYADLQGGAWYIADVSRILSAELMRGYGDGTFRPELPITRAEFAVIAARYLYLSPIDKSDFADCDRHWADGYIGVLNMCGLICGYEDGTFRPEQYMTRAEAVKIINGILGRAKVCTFAMQNPFRDLSPNHWAYLQILEAAQTHTCTGESPILVED